MNKNIKLNELFKRVLGNINRKASFFKVVNHTSHYIHGNIAVIGNIGHQIRITLMIKY